jgi:sigma-E factor negative regulatory protein RseC
MKAINNINAQVGDEVIVGLNEASLLKGAFVIYMLPLLFLFLFSFIGQYITQNIGIANNELLVIVFAIMGFLLGMKKVKNFSSSIENNESYQPVILKKSNDSSIFVNL